MKRSSPPLSRRSLLRAAGIAVALPWLESAATGDEERAAPAQRMLLISNNLGVLPKPFFPVDEGADYEFSPYLQILKEFRNDFSVFSGLSHPDVEGGHSTENCFLTGARGPTRSGFRNTISLDQFAAETLGPVTRFPTINLGVNIDKANRSLSWSRDGALLPAQDSPSALFRQMFLQEDSKQAARQARRLQERGSILDVLSEDARRLQGSLGGADKARLDQYLTSIREVEKRLQSARRWSQLAKPTTDQEPPKDIRDNKLFFEKFDLMLSMAALALQSDSTRIVTLMVDAFATPAFRLRPDQLTTDGYHNLSHHGQAPGKVKQLEDADRRQMKLLRQVLKRLAETQDGEQRLLDSTMVLYGSNMGDSNTHENTNLPILLAGGGFRHGRHHRYSAENNRPLSNLYVSMLHQLGVHADAFASSDGALSEL